MNPRHLLAGSHPQHRGPSKGRNSHYVRPANQETPTLARPCLPHVRWQLPKDILYGELATGPRPTGRPTFRYKDVLKRDLKAGGIAPAGLKRWKRTAAVGDTPLSQLSRQQSRGERSSGKKRTLAGAREQGQKQHPWTTTPSHAATVIGSAVRGSASTATAGAATLPRTDIYGRKLHCLPRQTDAY